MSNDPLPPDPLPGDPSPGKSHGRLSIRASAVRASAKPRDLMEEPRHIKGAWTAKIITLFPEAFPGILDLSLTGKGLQFGLWQLETFDLRTFGIGKHRNVDDTPAGGGAGMVLRADVLDAAIQATATPGPHLPEARARWPLVYLSPRGRRFDQAMARRFAACDGITLLCGRFEGVDERLLAYHQIEEVSLGDFVLTGGEIAATALVDATVRLIPGVLGNHESAEEESFSDGLLEHPQFTRPAVWNDMPIPDVLQSGHHGEIAKWRRALSERITKDRRPDLWEAYLARQTKPPKPR